MSSPGFWQSPRLWRGLFYNPCLSSYQDIFDEIVMQSINRLLLAYKYKS